MNKLEIWYEKISSFKRLSLNEARDLLNKANNIEDENLKKSYIDQVILGTLYVIYNHIKSYSLNLLSDSTYDMDDIISTFVEVWIKSIKDGKLFKVNHYSQIFLGSFYDDVINILIGRKYNIAEEIQVDSYEFSKIFYKYMNLRNKKDDITLNEFLLFLKGECKFLKHKNPNEQAKIFNLFEQIYNRMDFDKLDECDLAMTTFNNLKYLFINSALRESLSNYTVDFEEGIVNKIYVEEFMNIIKNLGSKSEYTEYINLLYLKFMECKTNEEIGNIYNINRETARQRKIKILKKLRDSKKLKSMID